MDANELRALQAPLKKRYLNGSNQQSRFQKRQRAGGADRTRLQHPSPNPMALPIVEQR
jgi:hypothetical protein